MRKIIVTCLMVTAIFVNSVYAADTPLIERVDTTVNNYDEYIDISDNQLSDEEIVAVMTEYFAKYSSAGLISCTLQAYDEDENGLYDAIKPDYRYSEKMNSIINRQIDRAEDKILAHTNGLTAEEKAQFVYSYFCKNFSYDSELNYDLKHLYDENNGTCAAFAIAYKRIMDKMDIPCKIALSADLTHEWNKVFINNEWLNLDITDGVRLYATGAPNAHLRTYLLPDSVYAARGYIEKTE